MSLGANLSSGYTNQLQGNVLYCSVQNPSEKTTSPLCCKTSGVIANSARYPSMVLQGKVCPAPSAAEFALFPKVAVQQSVFIERKGSCPYATLPDSVNRFSQYNRYVIPTPCPPLPQNANMAGISKPSTRLCNL
jgi:hypothetical protein